MGVWGRWQNVELQDLSSSSNISWMIKKIRRVRLVAGMRQKRNVCRVLVGTPEERRALRRPRHKWKLALEQNMKVLIGG
jgi:hypothetical protein